MAVTTGGSEGEPLGDLAGRIVRRHRGAEMDAIKEFREVTGASLSDAREAIEKATERLKRDSNG